MMAAASRRSFSRSAASSPGVGGGSTFVWPCSPRVNQIPATSAPLAAYFASIAAGPKLSSSGCASNVRIRSGSPSATSFSLLPVGVNHVDHNGAGQDHHVVLALGDIHAIGVAQRDPGL